MSLVDTNTTTYERREFRQNSLFDEPLGTGSFFWYLKFFVLMFDKTMLFRFETSSRVRLLMKIITRSNLVN
jgi:hypothetical protein